MSEQGIGGPPAGGRPTEEGQEVPKRELPVAIRAGLSLMRGEIRYHEMQHPHTCDEQVIGVRVAVLRHLLAAHDAAQNPQQDAGAAR